MGTWAGERLFADVSLGGDVCKDSRRQSGVRQSQRDASLECGEDRPSNGLEGGVRSRTHSVPGEMVPAISI